MVKILYYKSSQKLKYLNIVLLFDGFFFFFRFLDLYKSLQPLLYLENFEIGVKTLIFSLQLLEDVILLNKINLGKHSFYIIICLPTFSKLNSLYVFKNTYTSLFVRDSQLCDKTCIYYRPCIDRYNTYQVKMNTFYKC